MLPVSLDISKRSIALIGTGEKRQRRYEQLVACGAQHITLFDDASAVTADAISKVQLVLGVELTLAEAARIATLAREQGILVNMEDQPDYCDFHYASFIARGDLMLSVHSGGKSPALTQRIRDVLAQLFPVEWAERLESLAAKRLLWKKEGASNAEIIRKSNQAIDEEGWLRWNIL